MHIYVWAYMCIYIYILIYMHIYIYICAYRCEHAQLYIWLGRLRRLGFSEDDIIPGSSDLGKLEFTSVSTVALLRLLVEILQETTYTRICIPICIHIYLYVHMHIYIYIYNIYIYIYIYIYNKII